MDLIAYYFNNPPFDMVAVRWTNVVLCISVGCVWGGIFLREILRDRTWPFAAALVSLGGIALFEFGFAPKETHWAIMEFWSWVGGCDQQDPALYVVEYCERAQYYRDTGERTMWGYVVMFAGYAIAISIATRRIFKRYWPIVSAVIIAGVYQAVFVAMNATVWLLDLGQ